MLQADAVIHRSVHADLRTGHQAVPCGICVTQSDTGKGPSPSEDFGFPPTRIVTHMFHNHTNIRIKLSEREAGEAWAPFNKTFLMRERVFFRTLNRFNFS
jgi:hypothetical protein